MTTEKRLRCPECGESDTERLPGGVVWLCNSPLHDETAGWSFNAAESRRAYPKRQSENAT